MMILLHDRYIGLALAMASSLAIGMRPFFLINYFIDPVLFFTR
jgi:hypothetical protein